MASEDNQDFEQFSSSTPIVISSAGQHDISFYSVDNAGNQEPKQTITFSIEKIDSTPASQSNPPQTSAGGGGISFSGSTALLPKNKLSIDPLSSLSFAGIAPVQSLLFMDSSLTLKKQGRNFTVAPGTKKITLNVKSNSSLASGQPQVAGAFTKNNNAPASSDENKMAKTFGASFFQKLILLIKQVFSKH